MEARKMSWEEAWRYATEEEDKSLSKAFLADRQIQITSALAVLRRLEDRSKRQWLTLEETVQSGILAEMEDCCEQFVADARQEPFYVLVVLCRLLTTLEFTPELVKRVRVRFKCLLRRFSSNIALRQRLEKGLADVDKTFTRPEGWPLQPAFKP